MIIKNINARKIFDSRGESTLEVELGTEKGIFRAQVPSGKSKGKREVKSIDFPQAKISIDVLRREILEKEFSSVREFDEALKKIDSTKDKSSLGGNVMLGASIAFARARATEKNVSLWIILRREFFSEIQIERKPSIFSNLINGGAHAENGLDIQEFMLVLRPSEKLSSDIEFLIDFYKSVGNTLKKSAKVKGLPIGDESGYSVSLKDNFEPIKILEKEIITRKAQKRCSIALDVAASNFYSGKDSYKFEGKGITTEKLLSRYLEYFKKSKYLCSIEDPFAEDDDESFKKLQEKLGKKWVVGDDLTTTNIERIRNLSGGIRGVIIKPNQIGLVSETCDAIAEAKSHNMKTIISHRSGEVEDVFIISLARASSADGVKIGAPAHERIYKFNELIRVYE